MGSGWNTMWGACCSSVRDGDYSFRRRGGRFWPMPSGCLHWRTKRGERLTTKHREGACVWVGWRVWPRFGYRTLLRAIMKTIQE